MTLQELGKILHDMYFNAPEGDTVAMIHLFGIKYSEEILNAGFSKKEIIDVSGISNSYLTELNKGVKLAKYVMAK